MSGIRNNYTCTAFALWYCLIISLSCNSFPAKVQNENRCPGKTVKQDIPVYPDGRRILSYVYASQISEQLGLENIESGYDSLQIRVWLDPFPSDKHSIVAIRRNNHRWSAVVYRYFADYTKTTAKITESEMQLMDPKSGWDKFLYKLNTSEISGLPDYRKIPAYNDNYTHGSHYAVEIATCSTYRLFEYRNPALHPEVVEAKTFNEFIRLITHEFSIQLTE
jgi:hypothetical protein